MTSPSDAPAMARNFLGRILCRHSDEKCHCGCSSFELAMIGKNVLLKGAFFSMDSADFMLQISMLCNMLPNMLCSTASIASTCTLFDHVQFTELRTSQTLWSLSFLHQTHH